METESDRSETAGDSASTSASQESEPETETEIVWYLADDPEYKLDQRDRKSVV